MTGRRPGRHCRSLPLPESLQARGWCETRRTGPGVGNPAGPCGRPGPSPSHGPIRLPRSKSEPAGAAPDSDPGRFGSPIRNPGLRLPAAPAARPPGGRRGTARQPEPQRPGPGSRVRDHDSGPGPGGLSGAVAGAGAGARLVYLGHGHNRHVLERATAMAQ